MGFFFQDEWRARGNLTFNLGARWDLRYPFVEEHGHLVNLDVNSDFTAAEAVESGSSGDFSGAFPTALIDKDTNNFSPRLSAACVVSLSICNRGRYSGHPTSTRQRSGGRCSQTADPGCMDERQHQAKAR